MFGKVTPAIAKMLLGANVNRPIKMGKVEQMVRDMKSGEWRTATDQIGISIEGDLNNGQHRFTAVILSETEQTFSFLFGCTKEDMEKIDSGTSRTLFDVATLNGVELGKYGVSLATFLRRQTIQFMQRRATRSEEIDFINRHMDILQTVEAIFRDPNRKSPAVNWNVGNDVGAAFVRAFAHYSDNPAKIERLKIFAYGLSHDEDYKLLMSDSNSENSAFELLSRYLTEENGNQGQTSRTRRYRKTEKAIASFVERKPIKRLMDENEGWKERFELLCETEARIAAK